MGMVGYERRSPSRYAGLRRPSTVPAMRALVRGHMFCEVEQRLDGHDWNTIYVELWLDRGRIIAYPAKKPTKGWPFWLWLELRDVGLS